MVTDGGMETDLIFHHGVDLPALAIVGGCCGTDARHVEALWN